MTGIRPGIVDMRRKSRALGSLRAELASDTARTSAELEAAARAASFWISGDRRIGESDLAALLGITPGALANKRRDGSAPVAFNLAGGGHRVTYRLDDVARWIESHRDT